MNAPRPSGRGAMQDLAGVDPSVFFDTSPIATMVIDIHHIVAHFNQACALTLGVQAHQMIGQKKLGQLFYGHDRPMLVDLIVDGAPRETTVGMYEGTCKPSSVIPGAYEGEAFHDQTVRQGHGPGAVPVLRANSKHSGHISVHSEISKGTTFRVTLPILQPNPT